MQAMSPTILAECRPNLGACYFFVKNVPDAGKLSVEVGEQRITLRIPDEQLSAVLPSTVSLVPGSISGQTFTNNTLTFRTRVKSYNTPDGLDNNLPDFSPNFHINDATSLYCDFCKEQLTKARVFSRVLPLPSSDEPSDFFCHKHSNEHISLNPKPVDFFYNYFFFNVHVENFFVAPADNKFVCPKCHEILGEVKGETVKLWNSVVSFSKTGREQGKPIEKFLLSFARFIKDLPVQINKFVVTSSLCSTRHCTLIWIMDRALFILENPKLTDCNSVMDIHLEPKKVMKVLYSHHDQFTETAEDWMKSFNTSLIPVPPMIETELLKYLNAAADRLPPDSASVDGMVISYMDT